MTLALIHGGQPDALVLCHEPTRTHMRGLPRLPAAEPRGAARPRADRWRGSSTRRSRVVGVAINTAALAEADGRRSYLAETEARMGLPAVDPFRQGAGRLVDALA